METAVQHIHTTDIIRNLVVKINEAWKNGKLAELADYFHEDIVFCDSDFNVLAQGRTKCIESYRQFIDNAEVHEMSTKEPEVFVWHHTVYACYRFTISYTMNGKLYSEQGKEAFIFIYDNRTWVAVVRFMLPEKN